MPATFTETTVKYARVPTAKGCVHSVRGYFCRNLALIHIR